MRACSGSAEGSHARNTWEVSPRSQEAGAHATRAGSHRVQRKGGSGRGWREPARLRRGPCGPESTGRTGGAVGRVEPAVRHSALSLSSSEILGNSIYLSEPASPCYKVFHML